MTLHKRLRAWRVHLDLSLQDVAEAIGHTRQSISLYELGRRTPARADLQAIVIKGLGISMRKFSRPPTVRAA